MGFILLFWLRVNTVILLRTHCFGLPIFQQDAGVDLRKKNYWPNKFLNNWPFQNLTGPRNIGPLCGPIWKSDWSWILTFCQEISLVLVISRYWMTRKYEKSTGWKKQKLLTQVAREYQLAQWADLCSDWLALP
jgi:hypothetical protein